MSRRILHILLVLLLGWLTIGEAYHYHPDGGERWQFVSIPPVSSPSAAETHEAEGNDSPGGRSPCPLDFWASLLSTTILLVALLLLSPAPGATFTDRPTERRVSRTPLLLSARAPPLPA